MSPSWAAWRESPDGRLWRAGAGQVPDPDLFPLPQQAAQSGQGAPSGSIIEAAVTTCPHTAT
jgi:hypothetical protein